MKPLPLTSDLSPGDCMLYKPSSFFGWLIAVKSWTWISHVEVYIGNGWSVASRDGIGANKYPVRFSGLACVRRATPPPFLNLDKANAWFEKVKGQRYDFLGLLCFTLAVKQGAPDRMFCSEFATRWYRNAGLEPFNPEVDADHVAPSEFWQTPVFRTIWEQ